MTPPQTLKTHSEVEIGRHLSDLNASLRHFLTVIESQQSKARDEGALYALTIIDRLHSVISRHYYQASNLCEHYANNYQTLPKETVSATMGGIVGLFHQMRGDYSTSRAMRDNYAALSTLIASLTSLKTFGLMHGLVTISRTAYDMLEDLCPLVIDLCDQLPEIVARDVSQSEGTPYQEEVVARVRNAVRRCWNKPLDKGKENICQPE